jgi:hypothetical protein
MDNPTAAPQAPAAAADTPADPASATAPDTSPAPDMSPVPPTTTETPTPARLTPALLRHRHDGWTPGRQVAFIEALAETACVEEACKQVGMSRQTAYALRRRPCGRAFGDAWEAAIDYGLHQLEQAIIGRAIHGVPRPIFYKGEQVGEYREHDERLAVFLLRTRRPARYGAWLDREPSPLELEMVCAQDDSALRLDFYLDEIAALESEDDEPEAPADPAEAPSHPAKQQ